MHGMITHEIWKLECAFNLRLPTSPAGEGDVVRHRATHGIDVLSSDPAPPDADLVVVVTTHARARSCERLLERAHASLRDAGRLNRCFVVVLRDTSHHDYGSVSSLLEHRFPNRFCLYESSEWLGKPRRYLAFQVAFDVIRATSPKHALFLEDDVVIERDFVGEALRIYDSITDVRKAALYLCKFPDDEVNGRWVRFRRRPGRLASHTQWLDLHAFVAGPHFFNALGYRVFAPFASRFRYRPHWSSGVSEQFTRRLSGRGHVYQVNSTLARHGAEPSLLNPEARALRPLDNFGLT